MNHKDPVLEKQNTRTIIKLLLNIIFMEFKIDPLRRIPSGFSPHNPNIKVVRTINQNL